MRPSTGAQLEADAAAAAVELVELDRSLGHRVASFAPVLLRSEAASSSQIEHLTASARAIFSVEAGVKSNNNALMIAANADAMTAALDLAGDLSVEALQQMHSVLMRTQPRHTPGEFRTEAVWIGSSSASPRGAEFVAPWHEHVPGLLNDLLRFIGDIGVPPLVSAAVAHAQFETIHPFTDGNGRTGRALTQAMLRWRGITRSVVVPVSAGLLADVEGYHSALTAYRNGDVEPIVGEFVAATRRAVATTRDLVDELDGLRKNWETRLTVRRSSNVWKLLDVILEKPVLTAKMAAAAIGINSIPNIYPPLRVLTDAGILKDKSEYQVGPVWRSQDVLDAVDRFAAKAGRRE
ncbi:MAG: Fic family protein [Galactobacter sp.]